MMENFSTNENEVPKYIHLWSSPGNVKHPQESWSVMTSCTRHVTGFPRLLINQHLQVGILVEFHVLVLVTETEISSCWRKFRHWLHRNLHRYLRNRCHWLLRKSSKWCLPTKPLTEFRQNDEIKTSMQLMTIDVVKMIFPFQLLLD